MNPSSRKIRNIYLLLMLLHTLAASFIWGINTLFLLDAGLSNTEAFAANAFFTVGSVLFEVPTGVVADMHGRRTSYLLGTATLIVSTLLYVWLWHVSASFPAWALSSVFLGLGFTFFSGAVEAWLVDALTFTGHFRDGGNLESVLAKGAIVEGIAMFCGSVAGGAIAQATNLGVPYLVRACVLGVTFVVAWISMRDLGFTPALGKRPIVEIKNVLRSSIEYGLRNPPVRWVMLAAPFTSAASIYAFYAMQPYLLELHGNERAYGIAGLAAAIVAGAQVVGGLIVPYVGVLFRRRTSVLLVGVCVSSLVLLIIGLVPSFWMTIALLAAWGLMFAAVTPVRQAYLNGLIASKQRATVLSFDALLGSSGAAGIQPILGRIADAWSYPVSYACSALVQAMSIPFVLLARREQAPSDPMPDANNRDQPDDLDGSSE